MPPTYGTCLSIFDVTKASNRHTKSINGHITLTGNGNWANSKASGFSEDHTMSERPQESPKTEEQTTPQQQEPSARVLVTGASGFVGHHVGRQLLDEQYTPVCLARNPRKLSERLTDEQFDKTTVIQGNVFDPRSLDKAAENCSAAIHLVGIIEENPSIGQTFSRAPTGPAGGQPPAAPCTCPPGGPAPRPPVNTTRPSGSPSNRCAKAVWTGPSSAPASSTGRTANSYA